MYDNISCIFITITSTELEQSVEEPPALPSEDIPVESDGQRASQVAAATRALLIVPGVEIQASQNEEGRGEIALQLQEAAAIQNQLLSLQAPEVDEDIINAHQEDDDDAQAVDRLVLPLNQDAIQYSIEGNF